MRDGPNRNNAAMRGVNNIARERTANTKRSMFRTSSHITRRILRSTAGGPTGLRPIVKTETCCGTTVDAGEYTRICESGLVRPKKWDAGGEDGSEPRTTPTRGRWTLQLPSANPGPRGYQGCDAIGLARSAAAHRATVRPAGVRRHRSRHR